jgi:uncharacterized alpha-E superfamily protein
MLSRVAENLYWMSRYVERAENVARLLDDGFQFELDAGLTDDDNATGPIESILTILSCRADFQRVHLPVGAPGGAERVQSVLTLTATVRAHQAVTPVLDSAAQDAVLRFLTFDSRGCHSILSMIARARENARATQEALSAEAWSQVNRLYLYLSGPRAQRRFQASPFRFYDSVKRACILFDGLVDSTMPRTEVFHFLQLGRYLERVDMISRIINVNLRLPVPATPLTDLPLHGVQWTSLLRSCSAYEAYLREYQDRIDPINVVRYLVLGADFPRAMRFCVARCLESLKDLAGAGDDDGYRSEAERLLGRLDGELRYLDPVEVVSRGLAQFLNTVQETCNRVGQEIQQAYFLC